MSAPNSLAFNFASCASSSPSPCASRHTRSRFSPILNVKSGATPLKAVNSASLTLEKMIAG